MPKCKPLPPLEVLNRWFELDRSTGKLYWKERSGSKIRIGDEAGAIMELTSGHKRCVIKVPGYGPGHFYRYRLVWKMVYGVDPASNAIDHLDQDSLNDRPENLVDGGKSWNGRNKAVTAKSGYRGVIAMNGRWRVSYTDHGKSVYVGTYDTVEQAAEAYEKARQRLCPLQGDTV
jgi:hypothetical protein